MDIKWRNRTYDFTVRTMIAERDTDSRKVTIDKNIYAFDTESVLMKDRYEPICFQTSSEVGGERLIYLPEKAHALEMFIDDYVKYNSWTDFQEHYALMYGHNLIYDWGQLIKCYPDLLAILKTGIGLNEDYEIYRNSDYVVTLRKKGLFTGTAPHFTIKIQLSKREWVDLMFRDTFSFFPVSLSRICKDLGLEVQKMERQEDIGKRDYRKEEMNPDKEYFEKYAKIDALATRLCAEKIRELHKISFMTRIRVSSPGFAINKLYHIIPEGTKIISGTNDLEIMQLILNTYAGGRTGGIYHGKVYNISVLDFHSSYPASMCSLPSFSETMDYVKYPDPENLTIEDLKEIIAECHCFVEIDGEETDAKYPSLIKNVKGKLTPIYGKFNHVCTTGVEISVGLHSGSLQINKIHKLVMLIEMQDDVPLPFKIFIESAYHRKENAEKGSVDYTSAKLEMNASYGKLIESRSTTPICDEVRDIVLPYFEGMETDFGQMYYKEYIESLNPDSESNFEERYIKMIEELLDDPETDPEEVKYANFGLLSLTKLEYGRYVVPAAASLITATSRARLLAVMKVTEALYWDTDSVFIENYNKTEINKKLKTATKWLPPFVKPLRIGDALGELDLEIENASGYLAGTKRYFIKDQNNHIKKALHGIPTAPYDKANEIIENLATGLKYTYDGKPRPLSAKESKTPQELGKFETKQYESKFHLDERLTWTRTEKGWNGTVKTINEMEVIKNGSTKESNIHKS